MKLKLSLILAFLLFLSFFTKVAAVCPICTVAVGAGVGLCRFLGIDDTISGVWIGGLIFSSSLWLADFLKKRNIKLAYLNFYTTLFFFLIVFLSLYLTKMIAIPANTLWGFDKLLLGIIVGSISFILGVKTDKFLRKINNAKVYFYYQKVLIPLFYLTFISFIFYHITC